MISLKDFRNDIKMINPAYQVKVRSNLVSSASRDLKYLQVWFDGKFLAGSGANVYVADTVKKHQELFDLLRESRNNVFDNDIKVLF